MRKRPTPAEKRFRFALAECCSVLTCKYESQKTFWNSTQSKGYIVDFYVADYKLVIEIDGPTHDDKEQVFADEKRDDYFKSTGKRVLRILNSQTFDADYCKSRVYELCKIKEKKFRVKKIKMAAAIKDENGIIQCPEFTEAHYKRSRGTSQAKPKRKKRVKVEKKPSYKPEVRLRKKK